MAEQELEFKRVLFIGSKESGLRVLKEIYEVSPESLVGCVTVDDSADTRSELDGFKDYCHLNNISLNVLNGRCDLTESVEKYTPDLCIVMGWYYIIAEDLLDKVRGGFLGIHNSLLPSHRGFAPVVWSLIAGDTQTGFSVFSFDRGMDTGDIWYQGKVEILKTDYVADILDKLDNKIGEFFRQYYLDILLGNVKPHKQNCEGISYGARRTPEDGKIDWNTTADEIYNFIRAQSRPYPGAFTTYKGERITIWRSEVFPYPIQGMPGQIGFIDNENDQIVIVCGKNTGLRVFDLETEEGIVPAIRVIKSLNYKMGD